MIYCTFLPKISDGLFKKQFMAYAKDKEADLPTVVKDFVVGCLDG